MTEPRRQDGDVVDLLQRQHEMIRRLCDAVTGAPAAERDEPFRQLLRLMAVHEAVEEEIVHPYVRRRLPDGDAIVSDRLHEEQDGKRMLVALDALGPTCPGFTELFDRYRETLFTHIQREEASEFAGLREKTAPAERTAMAAAIKVATVLAPTHPHPGVETAMRNLLIGTPLAMIDRARDLIRQAMAAKPGAATGAPAAGTAAEAVPVAGTPDAPAEPTEPTVRPTGVPEAGTGPVGGPATVPGTPSAAPTAEPTAGHGPAPTTAPTAAPPPGPGEPAPGPADRPPPPP